MLNYMNLNFCLSNLIVYIYYLFLHKTFFLNEKYKHLSNDIHNFLKYNFLIILNLQYLILKEQYHLLCHYYYLKVLSILNS